MRWGCLSSRTHNIVYVADWFCFSQIKNTRMLSCVLSLALRAACPPKPSPSMRSFGMHCHKYPRTNSTIIKLIWRWSGDGTYSTKSTYAMMHSGSVKFHGHSLIWKTWAPLKAKIFLWLAFWSSGAALDRRPTGSPWTRRMTRVLPLWPGTRDHWPSTLCLPLHARSMVLNLSGNPYADASPDVKRPRLVEEAPPRLPAD